jgi:hypothetical protein
VPRNHRRQRSPLDQLHRQKQAVVDVLDRVDGDDVRMIQCGRGARFLVEAPESIWIARIVRREHLDGDVAAETRVARSIYFSHPATAEQRANLVRTDDGSRRQRHDDGD